jgi:hypothetical protein
MRIELIPQFYQQSIAEQINKIYQPFKPMFNNVEQQHVERLVNLLTNSSIAETDALLLGDLKQFIGQYDQRRNKNYKDNLDTRFVEWYESI